MLPHGVVDRLKALRGPGVACSEAPASDVLISKNKGDSIFVRGVVKDHSVGSLDLRDCEFFDSEKAAADADAKRLADEITAHDQAAKQTAADDEAKRLAMETASVEESARAAAATSATYTPPATSDEKGMRSGLSGEFERYVPPDDSKDPVSAAIR